MTWSARKSASDASSCRTTRLIGRADPVQRCEVGDHACDEERCGHDVTVVVVEEVCRREEVLGAGPADEDEVVPVEVALERQDRADDELDRDQDDGGQKQPSLCGSAGLPYVLSAGRRVSSTVRVRPG